MQPAAKQREAPRLTVVESVYYQAPGKPAVGAGKPFGRTVRSGEQPYARELTASQEWAPLDCGWIKTACLLHLHNDEKPGAGVVELASGGGPPWLVRGGESVRGEPSDLSALRVRSRGGVVRFTLTLFPA